jgi:hypothetical protein
MTPKERFAEQAVASAYIAWTKEHPKDACDGIFNVILINKITERLQLTASFNHAYDNWCTMNSSRNQDIFIEKCIDLAADAMETIFKEDGIGCYDICDKRKCCCKCKNRHPLYKFPFNNAGIGKGSILEQMGEICFGGGRAEFHNPPLGHTYCELFESMEQKENKNGRLQ